MCRFIKNKVDTHRRVIKFNIEGYVYTVNYQIMSNNFTRKHLKKSANVLIIFYIF